MNPLPTILTLALLLTATLPAADRAQPASPGDGIYRLTLFGNGVPRMSYVPATLWLERRGGAFVQGLALANLVCPQAHDLDFSGLKLEGDRLHGSVVVQWKPWYRTAWELARSAKTAHAAKEAPVARTYTIDLRLPPAAGAEACTDYQVEQVAKKEVAMVAAVRFDAPARPEQVWWEFGLVGLLQSPGLPEHQQPLMDADIRFICTGPQPSKATVFGRGPENAGNRNPFLDVRPFTIESWRAEQDTLSFKGSFMLKDGDPACTVAYSGRRLGWLASGQATVRRGETTWTIPVLGRWRASGLDSLNEIREPVGKPAAYAAKPDPALVAAAVAQANEPLFVAEPGGREFWYWRYLAAFGKLHCIHPPFFEIKKMPGAARYRLALKAAGGKEYAFEADKPWRPLTAIWKDLPYGDYTLSVTGLDAGGKPLAMPAEFHRWEPRKPEEMPDDEKWKINKGWAGGIKGEYKTKSVWYVPSKPIQITKRRPFQGPYRDELPPGEVQRRVLKAARWLGQLPGWARSRGMLPVWISNPISVQLMKYGGHFALSQSLLVRLSEDPVERLEARLVADEAGALMLADQEGGAGLNKLYANHTSDHYRDGLTYLDLLAATDSPVYRQAILRTARECLQYQLPNGALGGAGEGTNRRNGQGTAARRQLMGGHFWPDGAVEIREFPAAPFLRFLGRLRQDLELRDFLENEARGLGHVRANLAGDFFWPDVGPHTPPLMYPCAVNSQGVQRLLVYLLQHAEAKDRDLKLIEDLALWCEDRNLIWDRRDDATSPTAFLSKDGFRSGGPPANHLARMGLVYALLWREIGNPLHRAKAWALIGTVLAAQDPETGFIPQWYNMTAAGEDGTPAHIWGFMLCDLWEAGRILEGRSEAKAGK